MCGLKLGTEAVKKLEKKRQWSFVWEVCWQRTLTVAMLFAFVVQSPSWSSALDYKGNGVCCLPSGGHKAWDEAAGALWIGFTGRVLHGVHLGFERQKKPLLKPFPKLNTMKHRNDLWAALLSQAVTLAMPTLGTGAACCSAWSELKWRLARLTCFSLSRTAQSPCG